MTTVLLIAVASALFGTLGSASRGARDGYEDELGFHYGSKPTRRSE